MRLFVLTMAALAVASTVGASTNPIHTGHYVPCPPSRTDHYVRPTIPPPPPVCP